MDRDYKTGKSKSVGVFSGLEIEHTPAYGKQTLFLARNDLTYDQIQSLCLRSRAEAVYFGANRCYVHGYMGQVTQMEKLVADGFYVTVDYPHSLHSQVKEKFKTLWNNPLFIPFCSIIFPHSEDDEQLYIKVDDVDFNATGPGVWTMSMNYFKQSSGFTSWDEYKQDEPIEEKEIWPLPIQK
tara:strand:- start:107 stop:652 length:546 start_codon:yes stop_codon:yes gene_type:complete